MNSHNPMTSAQIQNKLKINIPGENTSASASPTDEFQIKTIGDDKFEETLFDSQRVFICKANYNNSPVAIKNFFQRKDFEIEVQNLKLVSILRSPRIIKFYGYAQTTYQKQIVTELLDETLLQLVTQTTLNKLTEIQLMIQITQGVADLHKNNILHRDLKSTNIFVNKEPLTAKIGDFGSAIRIDPQTTFTKTEHWGCTRLFSAPEVTLKNSHSKASDMYSLGMTLWQIISKGAMPFSENADAYKLSLSQETSYQNPFPTDTIPQLAEIICSTWNFSPVKRPPVEKVLEELQDIALELQTKLIK